MEVPSTIYQLNFNTIFSSFPLIASFSDDEIDTYSACPFKELIDEKKEKGVPFVLAVMQDIGSFNMRCYSAHELPLIKDLKTNPQTKQDIKSLFYFVLAAQSDRFHYAGNSNDEFIRVVQNVIPQPAALDKIVEFKLDSLFAPLNMRAIVSLKDVEMRSNELDFPSLLAFHPQFPDHKVRCFDAVMLEKSNESFKLTTGLFFTHTLNDYEFVGAFKDGKMTENLISLNLKANNGDRESLYQLGKYYLEKKTDQDLQFGFQLIGRAANKGFIPALMELGRLCLHNNLGFALNLEQSKEIFEKILKSNQKPVLSVINEAKLLLAFCYYYLTDYERAQKVIAEFLQTNPTHRQACMLMGFCYFKRSSAKNYLQSAKKYLEVAEKKAMNEILDPTILMMLNVEHEARFLLHHIYYTDGDNAKGLALLMNLANDGYVGAQYKLGNCFLKGEGVIQDQKRGFRLLQKCALNYVPAQFVLGKCYKDGHGVNKDLKKARECIVSAAHKGHPDARTMLILENKELDLPNDQFIYWLKVLIAEGKDDSAIAQYFLGICHQEGQGVEKNDKNAFDCWMELAKQNYLPAQHAIGYCYFDGRGVEKDVLKAYAYWKKAAAQGHIMSQQALKVNFPK